MHMWNLGSLPALYWVPVVAVLLVWLAYFVVPALVAYLGWSGFGTLRHGEAAVVFQSSLLAASLSVVVRDIARRARVKDLMSFAVFLELAFSLLSVVFAVVLLFGDGFLPRWVGPLLPLTDADVSFVSRIVCAGLFLLTLLGLLRDRSTADDSRTSVLRTDCTARTQSHARGVLGGKIAQLLAWVKSRQVV